MMISALCLKRWAKKPLFFSQNSTISRPDPKCSERGTGAVMEKYAAAFGC